MKRVRAWLRSFFAFSRSESNAFLILIPLLLFIIFAESLYEAWVVRQSRNELQTDRLDSLMAHWQWEEDSVKKFNEPRRFAFNPNTATQDQLLELGFSKLLADRIINYRSKKGVFRIKSDLLKMYGMDSTLYHSLSTFILLPDKPPIAEATQEPFTSKPSAKPDLNAADSVALLQVYGIGPKLAHRIIGYRSKLGGFISSDQLQEVYGLDTAVIAKTKSKFQVAEDFVPRKVNINAATETELGQHPYIGRSVAKAIIAYRFQHGAYQKLEDLLSIRPIDEAKFLKMKPYLTY